MRRGYYDYGREATFITHGDVGYKFFKTSSQCLYTYYMQAYCHQLGLAPKIGRIVTCETHTKLGREEFWGYEAEIAAAVEGRFDRQEIVNKYWDVGVSICDVISFNLGVIDDEIVMIDFGDTALIGKIAEDERYEWNAAQVRRCNDYTTQ